MMSLPFAAKGIAWELSITPAADCHFENTYEALISPDLSCGAGAVGTAGCSEAILTATFDRLVRVRRIRIGVDLMAMDFDASRLNGAKLQYQPTNCILSNHCIQRTQKAFYMFTFLLYGALLFFFCLHF